jgi:hypothetical protein
VPKHWKHITALTCLLFDSSLQAQNLDAVTSFGHGTVVITYFSEAGITTVSDGLQIFNTPSLAGYIRSEKDSNPKVVVCGGAYLCGGAGVYPLTVIDYDFKADWLPLRDKTMTTVRAYAEAVRAKSKETFRNLDAVLSKNEGLYYELLRSEDLERYSISGYDGKTPWYCFVAVFINPSTRTVEYPEVQCKTPVLKPLMPEVLTGHETKIVAEALKSGTKMNLRMTELLPAAKVRAKNLFPKASPAFIAVISEAAVMIQLHDEVYPKNYGRKTWVGVISGPKAKTPSVVTF